MASTNPIDQAQAQQALAMLASLPADIRQQVSQAALSSQRKVMALPYYSTIRFQSVVAGAGPFVYTVGAQDRVAFNYKIGDVPAQSGFDVTYGAMTDAETNLLVASQTRNNEDVFIWGIAAMLSSDSDAQIAQLAFRNSSLRAGFSGDDSYLLGRLDFLPGGGGLTGIGTAYLATPDLASSNQTRWGTMTNGAAGRDNYYRLPQALIWRGTGTGKDTSLTLTCTQRRNFSLSIAADRAAAAGVAAFAHPTTPNTLGTYADVTYRLVCVSVGKRSENS